MKMLASSTARSEILWQRLLIIYLALLLSGCGGFFPSFEGAFGLGSWIHDVPVNNVATQVQCELQVFAYEHPEILDPEQSASLTLKLQIDDSGSVTYWPAPGSEDTELGVLMELEVGHGETEVYPRIQA